jgi:hypothetical protein
MGATSVTGVSGPGICGKATMNELTQHSLGPQILVAGRTNEGIAASPDGWVGTVTLPQPLPPTDAYCVFLTCWGASSAWVTDLNTNDDGELVGFDYAADLEGTIMYMVTKTGTRA